MDKLEKVVLLKLSQHFNETPKIIDVGGNIGLWSEYVLTILKPETLYIFEPESNNYKTLIDKFMGIEEVKIINKGVGDKEGEFEYFNLLTDDSEARGMSGFIKRVIYNKYCFETQKLVITTLDNFINTDIDFIKIDVEGYEFNVLKGMSNMLSDNKCKFIQFEYGGTYLDANIKINDIIQYLNSYGYSVYEFKNESFVEVKNKEDDFIYNNFIATKIDIK